LKPVGIWLGLEVKCYGRASNSGHRMDVWIRNLDPVDDLDLVDAFTQEAADYWHLADRRAPDRQKAQDFFTDCPPGCDPAASQRLGMFTEGGLVGIAELSFGWPSAVDPYLGLQLLAPRARGRGLGRVLLGEVEARARATGAKALYLAVLEENPKRWTFWRREGFRETGVSGVDADTGHRLHRLVKDL
jgi:GNAT superfamily N-acetyltransferase